MPLYCAAGTSCTTIVQQNWFGFGCCPPGQACGVETGCIPYTMIDSCADNADCGANPYLLKW